MLRLRVMVVDWSVMLSPCSNIGSPSDLFVSVNFTNRVTTRSPHRQCTFDKVELFTVDARSAAYQ